MVIVLALAACSNSGPPPVKVLASFDAGESATFRPPDAGIAAGDSELLEATNSGVHLLDRKGFQIGPPATTNVLFGSVVARNAHLSDPRVAWDPAGRRFLIVMFDFLRRPPCATQAQCGDRLLVAVSRGARPRGFSASDWMVDAEPMSSPGAQFIQSVDFPSMAVTPDTLVVTLNAEAVLPGNGGGSPHERVRLIDLAALERDPHGAPYHDLDDLRDAEGRGGVSNVMPAMGAGGVVLVMTDSDCRVRLWQVEDPLGSPKAVAAIAGRSGSCGDALNASQPGKVSSLEVDGPRFHSRPSMRDGRLWVVQTVSGPGRLAEMHWIELDVSRFPNVAVLNDGRLAASDASVFYPAVQAGPDGSAVIVYARSGAKEKVTVEVTGRARADQPGTLRPPAALHVSEAVQETAVGDPSQRNRFGDYYDTSPDPDGRTAWVTGEYIRAPEQWSMWVGRVSLA